MTRFSAAKHIACCSDVAPVRALPSKHPQRLFASSTSRVSDSTSQYSRWPLKVSFIARPARTTLPSHYGNWRLLPTSILVLVFFVPTLFAQVQTPPVDVQASSASNGSASSGAPLTITLQDALQRAKANEPQFRSAVTALRLAGEDRVQARAALLPSVTYNNSFAYTQGVGRVPACATPAATCAPVRFIANNGVHEYISKGAVHEAVSLTAFASYSRSSAMLAEARAKAEIARRGLVVTVTQAY